MAVPALAKPAFQRCSKLAAEANQQDSSSRTNGTQRGGCTDYQNRPAACRDFRCLWLQGFAHTGSAHRPDKLGLMLVATIDPQVIQVRESRPDAARSPQAAELIITLRRSGLRVELVNEHEQRTLQPLTMFGRPLIATRPMRTQRARR